MTDKEVAAMTVFYDPKDEKDLRRIEQMLRANGIEFFLKHEPAEGIGPAQVHVAEEDFPFAEDLLLRAEAQEKD
jgi:hypothetical protein